MAVRAKFHCSQVKTTAQQYSDATFYTYELQPVNPPQGDPDHENRKWWNASPSGKLELTTRNPMPLEAGREYFLDITPAPAAPKPAEG